MYNSKSGSNKRKQIWEITGHLLCSVCGTCLSMEEQRSLMRKLGIAEADYLDYEVHSLMVQGTASLNKLSYQVNNLLNKKYRYDIAQYGQLEQEEFAAVWKEHYSCGDVCGLYWTAVTHPGLSEDFVHILFCDVHMLSHLNGGVTRKEKAEYKRMEMQNSELKQKLNAEKRLRKEQERELLQAQNQIRQLETRLSALEKTEVPYSYPGVQERQILVDAELQKQLDLLRQEEQYSREMIQTLVNEKDELTREVNYQQKINQQLYSEIQRLLSEWANMAPMCQKSAEEASQCKRRILMVGGLTRISQLYKEVAEGFGYDFSYHDGYMNSGGKELKDLIQNVDMVLCSTDCNSHGACHVVKRTCKQFNKDCYFLNNTSLSSISRTLQQLKQDDNIVS